MKPRYYRCFKYLILLTLIAEFYACSSSEKPVFSTEEYGYDVGDIAFDPTQDDPLFKLCDESNNIYSRSALVFDSADVKNILKDQYIYKSEYAEFSGFIMIRFVMNCHRETGRFRADPMNFDFSPTQCPSGLLQHIIGIVSGLKGWRHRRSEYQDRDCTKYLNFKIQNGKIQAILQ